MTFDPTTETIGSRQESDDLYIGYLPAAPPRVVRFVRRLAPAIVIAAVGVAALIAVLQAPFDAGVFEFGQPRSAQGRLIERPYPFLVEDGAARATVLVREGKHGAGPDAAGLDGRRVKLEGTRIESALGSMLELVPESIEPLPGNEPSAAIPPELVGWVSVRGELVDPKCYLGVMKPGRGKPHRSCAARCLSGGIPPHLLVTAAGGDQRLLLLVTTDDGPLEPDSFLDLVGEPVEASGTIERRAGILVLRLDADGLRPARR